MNKHSGPAVPRTRRFPVVVWPVLALLAGGLLWGVTISRSNAELERADALVRKEAAAYAEAYEQYITRSVAQMDQITMQLKFSLEQSRDPVLLETLKREGMFTDSAFVAVIVLDRTGSVRSATHAVQRNADLSATRLFAQHKNNISNALRIGAAPAQLAYGADVVLFSRRLDTADDEFDGVVMMAVDARYFTSFVSAATLGADGLVAMVGAESSLRVEQYGDGAIRGAPARAILPTNVATWSKSERGVTLVRGAGGFADGKARVLGWRRSPAYPLVALVALSHDIALAAAQAQWRASRNAAIVASFGLALLAALAALLSRRAAVRAREQDEVRQAYRTATESANDGFYMASALRDRDGQIVDFRIVDCNERAAYFYGMSRAELLGLRLSLIARGPFGEELLAVYRKAMEEGYYEDDRQVPGDKRLNIAWGHRRLVRVGNGLAVTLQDVSQRKAHQAELERLANEDTLTGLPNRHALLDLMPTALAQADTAATGLALLFIDLDEFKQVNDAHGHAVGDQLLKVAAQRLVTLLRPSDQVARFGGDEFVVLLQPCEGERQIAAVAERIVSAFGAPFVLGDELHGLGVSVGISIYPRDGNDTATLIRHADIAMYAGKNEGKGQYRFFDPSLSSTLKTRAQLKQNLLEAIATDQFVLHYQPRVETHTGELLSMEALLRWQHPQLGMIPPGDFIPLAETTGLIVRIGEMVIDKACAQIAAWRAEGAPLVPVSINVSPRQFVRGGVKGLLLSALLRHEVPPALVEVEITESAMMGDHDAILDELAALRALGIKLHVDDFGTGYSSLSQLQRLKMDVLKVDRAFTAELDKSKEGKVFFQAIVSMAHALGMSVVAEGVETRAQLEVLRRLDCNEVQGYLVARAVPPEQMAQLMRRRYLFPESPPTKSGSTGKTGKTGKTGVRPRFF
jgi:diguanylate cyclase (GGDEF)-like protein